MAEISIIVPVYQAERYIHECIGSILSQTFVDFELLLVDDGSPDNCLAICREYAARDSRVRVFHQENQGQSAARNFALTQALGQWICYVDSDDAIHPQMLERLYRATQESGAPISMCGSVAGETISESFFAPCQGQWTAEVMEENRLAELFDAGSYPGWVVWGKLIRKEIVESYPMAQGRIYEDNEAVCHWICQAGTLAVMPDPMYFYRTNPNSTTQKAFSRKRLDYLWALERIIRFYGEMGYLTLQQRFCGLYADAAADYYRNCMVQKWPLEAEDIHKKAKEMFLHDRIPLTKRQFEIMLDAFHPKVMPAYWILEAVYRRLKKMTKGA